jgi:nucleotide-binding universal stress UspA family protein
MGFKKILVAIARSPEADRVFETALTLARQEGANLYVFHCLGVGPVALGPGADLYGEGAVNSAQVQQEVIKKEMEDVEKWLHDYRKQARGLGIPAEFEYQIGDAGWWIREIASRWGADLVVVGRHGRSSLAEFFLGSVSNHVLHHVKCSVLVVQGEAESGIENRESLP